MSVMVNYDIDEFEELMAQSRSGGREMRNLRLCKSLPTSPYTSPKRSPETETKVDLHLDFPTSVINDDAGDTSVYTNLLKPPDPYHEIQSQIDACASGARPKLARMASSPSKESFTDSLPVSNGIRRTQSCRRPTTIKRHEHGQFTYRQRAHANAWRKHANTTSTDEELEENVSPENEPEIIEASQPDVPARDEDDDLQDCKIYRVRSFRTTTSGIVNRGDSFKIKSRRQSSKHNRRNHGGGRRMSTDTTTSHSSVSREDLCADSPNKHKTYSFGLDSNANSPKQHQMSGLSPVPDAHPDSLSPFDIVPQYVEEEPCAQTIVRARTPSIDRGLHAGIADDDDDETQNICDDDDETQALLKVTVVGMHGVGKRTLTRQLLTSEYLANTDRYQDEDQENVKIVSVMLDDEESVVQFVDIQRFQDAKSMNDVDAYLVVYSVTDRNSFAYAHACLQDLTKKGSVSRRKVIILVANKQDSVRNRVVMEQEGRSLASHRHCKYTEVSALLDHKVDELLVGTIRQVRINQTKLLQATSGGDGAEKQKLGCLQRAAVGLFRRIFKKSGAPSEKPCDDLLTP